PTLKARGVAFAQIAGQRLANVSRLALDNALSLVLPQAHVALHDRLPIRADARGALVPRLRLAHFGPQAFTPKAVDLQFLVESESIDAIFVLLRLLGACGRLWQRCVGFHHVEWQQRLI